VGLRGSFLNDMGHKGPVERPRGIGAVRSRTQNIINQSIYLYLYLYLKLVGNIASASLVWRLLHSGMQSRVVWWQYADVSE
jgi:hypothetical protein